MIFQKLKHFYSLFFSKLVNTLLRMGNKDLARFIVFKVQIYHYFCNPICISEKINNIYLTNLLIYCIFSNHNNPYQLTIPQTFENIKLKQIEYYNNTESEFEKELIETDPTKLFHKAVENCKPLLNIEKIKRGGVQYQVFWFSCIL